MPDGYRSRAACAGKDPFVSLMTFWAEPNDPALGLELCVTLETLALYPLALIRRWSPWASGLDLVTLPAVASFGLGIYAVTAVDAVSHYQPPGRP